MARLGVIALGLLCGVAATPAVAQLYNFSENQPGRVYYVCRATINGADMWTAFAEDGSTLGYSIKAAKSPDRLVFPDARDGTDRMPHFRVELHWPAELSIKRIENPAFDANNVSVEVHYMTSDAVRLDRKAYPWSQFIVARNDNFYFYEDDDGRGMILPVAAPALMTELSNNDATYRFHSPLSTLTQWANTDGEVTIYKVFAKRQKPQKGQRDALPFNGARRIVYSYRLDVDGLNQWAAQTAQDFVTWQAGLTDFRTTCTREVEEDESQVIIV